MCLQNHGGDCGFTEPIVCIDEELEERHLKTPKHKEIICIRRQKASYLDLIQHRIC